jgi:hypothetical protein
LGEELGLRGLLKKSLMYSFKPSLLFREEERRMASIFILGVVAGDAASFQDFELVVPVSRGISPGVTSCWPVHAPPLLEQLS